MRRSFGHEDAGLATPETLNNIVKNFTIRAFLETNDKRYLVGPKGSGKSLLLLRKAIDQRKKGDLFAFHPIRIYLLIDLLPHVMLASVLITQFQMKVKVV